MAHEPVRDNSQYTQRLAPPRGAGFVRAPDVGHGPGRPSPFFPRFASTPPDLRRFGEEAADIFAARALPPPPDEVRDGSDALNPRLSFDQFIIGDSNRLAHAAALAVAEMPGQAYNPLFLHAPPGLGKTHLLHAIGNYVLAFGGSATVRYATVESFTNHFITALGSRSVDNFKRAYRDADVLLIDDVQFLASKAKTEEEFFHTFNALYEADRQLVLTCDRLPRQLTSVEERLRERFESGLVADIRPPDFATRVAILRKREAIDGIFLNDDSVLELLDERCPVIVSLLVRYILRIISPMPTDANTPTAPIDTLACPTRATTSPLVADERALIHSFYSPCDFYLPSEVFIVKISLERDVLLGQLQTVSRVASTRSAIQALSGVQLAASSELCELRATDMDVGLRVPLEADVTRDGVVVLPARLIVDVVRSLPSPSVSLELRAAEQDVEVVSGKATFHIRTLRTEDFPPFPEPEPESAVSLPAEAFVSTALKVAGSASRDETRPVLTGILVSASDRELRMVATDSYRLSVKETGPAAPVPSAVAVTVPAPAL